MATPTPTPESEEDRNARLRANYQSVLRSGTPTTTPARPSPTPGTAVSPTAPVPTVTQQRVPEADGRGFLEKVSELDQRIKERWPGIVAKPFTIPFSLPGDEVRFRGLRGFQATGKPKVPRSLATRFDRAIIEPLDAFGEAAIQGYRSVPYLLRGEYDPRITKLRGMSTQEKIESLSGEYRERPLWQQIGAGLAGPFEGIAAIRALSSAGRARRAAGPLLKQISEEYARDLAAREAQTTALAVREPVEAAAAEGLRRVPTTAELQRAGFGTTPPPSRVLTTPAPSPATPLPINQPAPYFSSKQVGPSQELLSSYYDVLEPVVAPPRATPAEMAQELGTRLPETPPPAIPLGPSAAARAGDVPAVHLRHTDVETKKGWGADVQIVAKREERLGGLSGEYLAGTELSWNVAKKADLPDTLYHVTANPEAIEASGSIRAMTPERAAMQGIGLGGRTRSTVSLTASRETAEMIQRELGRLEEVVRTDPDNMAEVVTRIAKQDETIADLAEGSITKSAEFTAVLDEFALRKRAGTPDMKLRSKELYDRYLSARENIGYSLAKAKQVDPERYVSNLVGSTYPSLQNPIFFGIDDAAMARIIPGNVRILEVSKASIPDEAFIRKQDFLDEAEVFADIPVAPTAARAPGNWVYHKTNEASLQDIVDQGFGQGDFIEGMAAFNKLDLPGNVILRVKRANLPPGQIGEYSGAKWHLPNYEAARAPLSPDLIEIKVNKAGNPATVREAGATWKPLREYVADKAPAARAPGAGPAPADLLYPGRPGTRELPTTQYRGGASGIPRLYRDAPVPQAPTDVPTRRIPTTEELQRTSLGTGMRRVRAELPPEPPYYGSPGLTPQQPSARPRSPLTMGASSARPRPPVPSPQRVPAPDISLYDEAYAGQEALRKYGLPARATRAQAARAASEAPDTAATIARGGGEIPPGTPVVADAGSLPPSSSKVMDHISFEEPRQRLLDRFRSGLAGLKRAIADDLHPIDRFVTVSKELGSEVSLEENPYIWARLLRGISGKSNTFLEKGTFGKRYWKTEGGRAVPDFKGPGLYQILESVRDAGNHQAFSAYLTARRAVELADKGIVTGITKQAALKEIAELDSPVFRRVAQQVYKYQDDLIEYSRESGLLSNEMVARLRNYKDYVPFHRVMDSLETQGFTGKKMANIASPIKRILGSERRIINPLESMIKNTHALIEASDRNQVGVMMARMAAESPEMQSLFKAKKAPVSKVATVNAKELGIDISGLSEADADMLVDIFRPATYAKGANEITVMINGQKRFFDVDPDLYKSLTNIDQIDLGLFGKFFGAPARWLRAGAVLSPDFMVKNPIRDQLTAFVYSKFGFLPGIDWMKGMGQMLNKSDDYHLYRMSGAEHSNLVSVDRAMTGRTVKEIAEEKGFTDYIKNPVDLLRTLSEVGEKGTRLGEFSRGLAAGESPIAAGFSAREVSQDFSKMGVVTRAVNQIIPFFGANVGGWTRAKTAFTEKPIQSSAKAFLGITLPSILLYSINRNDPRYKEIPQWQKDLFWIIPTPNAMLRFPKPFLVGQVFGSVPERFLEFLDERDPEMLAETLKSAVGEGVPGWAPQAVLPWVENATNHNFFLDRPVVPRDREDAPKEMQYSGRTSEAAKALGKWVNLSPAQVDNVFYAYTGGLGRYVADSLDPALRAIGIADRIADPDPTWADLPILRSFVVRDPYGSSGVSVDKFYDALKDFEGQEKMYKELIALGRQDAVVKYKDSHPSAGLGFDYKYGGVHYSATARALRRVAGAMSDIRKYQRGVYNSRTMSGAEKRSNIDASNKQLTLLAQKALADLEKILP